MMRYVIEATGREAVVTAADILEQCAALGLLVERVTLLPDQDEVLASAKDLAAQRARVAAQQAPWTPRRGEQGTVGKDGQQDVSRG